MDGTTRKFIVLSNLQECGVSIDYNKFDELPIKTIEKLILISNEIISSKNKKIQSNITDGVGAIAIKNRS